MSNKATIRVLLILFALVLPASAQQQTITGKVVGVTDGDTITVLDDQKRQHKIRLDGIDAPESNQDFGSRAKQSLSDLVFGKTVTVSSSKVSLRRAILIFIISLSTPPAASSRMRLRDCRMTTRFMLL
jgi:endonuclease YncB( thermonuclease family)